MTNGGHKASYRMQTSLVGLLAEIWKKIEQDPTLLQFFFNTQQQHSSSPKSISPKSISKSLDKSSSSPSLSPKIQVKTKVKTKVKQSPTSARRPKLLLFTALIPFMQLHSRRTGLKSRDAILSALALRDASLFDFIAHQTLFCRRLAEGLGKYSKRRRSNVAVIIVRIIFISSFLFYYLLLNHSFPTNPNKITNCFQLILSIVTLQLHLLNAFVYFDF